MRLIEISKLIGPNIYTYYPAIRVKLDLEDLDKVESKEVERFNSKLITLIPTLKEHYCALGQPGGFLIRLKEGTYFGHVVEHVAIELLNLIGHKVNYGCTRESEVSGIYNIIYEYQSYAPAILAGKEAYKIVKSIINGQEVSMEEIIEGLNKEDVKASLGPSTQAIVDAAHKRNIPTIRLGKRNSLVQLGYGIEQKRIQATISQITSCVGVDIACNKNLAKELLKDMGVPVAKGDMATTEKEALEIARNLEGKIVTKPYNSNQGKGISLNIKTDYDVMNGFKLAQSYSQEVMVEKMISGNDYRVLVINGEVVAVAQRIPAHIVGDGEATILELIQEVNKDPLRGEGHSSPLTRIRVDEAVLFLLAKQDYHLDSVISRGEQVFLRETGNLSTGGTAIDKTDEIHPVNKQLAIRAAKVIGLDIAGIDLITPDISQPLNNGRGAIIEVNAAPGIRMHHYPTIGKSHDVAGAIVDMLFPAGNSGRIPIISITGTNGKTTVTRLVSLILQQADYQVGMTTTDGIYINQKRLLKGDTTGPISAQFVLKDSDVEVAVLETARGGILRAGLGYDESDIGVITNISSDHLGQGGVEDLEDLADVKSLVIERVNDEGTAILNADDQEVVKLSSRSNVQNIIYISSQENNFILRKHLAQGGTGIYVKDNRIIINHNQKEIEVEDIREIPATYKGIAKHMVENILFATAIAFDFGIDVKLIKNVLNNFGGNHQQNLGRLNIVEIAGVKVILDYGHNLAGYQATLEVARELEAEKVIGVIGVPGDRKDESILEIGKISGEYLQKVIIKEDQDLRGRKEGEVAELLASGVNNAEDKLEIEIVLSEIEAVKQALNEIEPGQLLIIFYEKDPAGLLDLIQTELKLKEKKLAEILVTE
ncbi:cyanophycin synthetase [Selenihalanaerobacter shriftii]|uniref:Cyanophycin synthetase n=1 Tax=Selenihalanaerobacter shriftii TaxID=142842 RepID=A0A1T4N5H7_9FIRM|nr:cyanophycin synthetase [Selenihalanaerobacter shriftii]SJZ74610.1 cyanophycin synthetase [Selenihalanaerobacter shriftii]